MTANFNTNSLADQLIAAVAKSSRKNILQRNRLKRRVEEALRTANYACTDHFAVAQQLEGLQEKFQVFNRDELAYGLRARLDNLDKHKLLWLPEMLSLLLQLSDRPVQLSSMDRLEELKRSKPEKKLSWSDLDISGSAYCDDDIWEDINFATGSSEDDVSSVFSIPPSPRTPLEDSNVPDEEEYVIPNEVFLPAQDESLIFSISSTQFWNPEGNTALSGRREHSSRVVTELQMLRETIFMLQGLPTALFQRQNGAIKVNSICLLPFASNAALPSTLSLFCPIGAKIGISRRFASGKQSVPYMQTFHGKVEEHLRGFDMFLSEIQTQYLSPKAAISVSIIRLLDDVKRESRLLSVLSDLISSLERRKEDDPMRCLDMLYDLVCMTQAAGGNEEFRFLAELFLSCVETYLRPVRLWMEGGQLDPRCDTFFVNDTRRDAGLRTLWHDWYTLDESGKPGKMPKFLQHVARKIFTAGKTMVFLRHLEVLPDAIDGFKPTSLAFKDLFPRDCSLSLCLPFSALLEDAFEKLVSVNLSCSSSMLRSELDKQCGLWLSLQALEHIYFCKNMSISSAVDSKVFELIDRRGAWNDRFLLTELLQSAYGVFHFVDQLGLTARARTMADEPVSSRSVKILQAFSFEYALPWPVANIVTKESIATHQRISTFLMQIRRAKYTILKQRAQDRRVGSGVNASGYVLRHSMLWFLDTVYSYMTDLAITKATESMRSSLSSSTDVEAMISVYCEYMTSLESQCLLSKGLAPLHDAVISLLDTCIQFADFQEDYSSAHSFASTLNSRSPPKTGGYFSTVEDEDDTDDESHAPHRTNSQISSYDSSLYAQQLKSIESSFNTLVDAVIAGLKAVRPGSRQHSFGILSERLEWRERMPLAE